MRQLFLLLSMSFCAPTMYGAQKTAWQPRLLHSCGDREKWQHYLARNAGKASFIVPAMVAPEVFASTVPSASKSRSSDYDFIDGRLVAFSVAGGLAVDLFAYLMIYYLVG